MFRRLALALVLALLPALPAAAQRPSRTLTVGQGGAYATLAAALSDAAAGDVIEVSGGVHPAVVIDKPLTLIGRDGAVIDGGGDGTVVTINAPDVALRGFVVRGSGVEPDQDHGGVTINAPRARVEDNVLTDVLFGVFAAKGDDSVIRANTITSKAQYDESRKGDAIRLWYSPRVRIEGNHVERARDVVVWYSDGVVLRDNLVEDGRYGVHLMYASDSEVVGNVFRDNSVGIYTMYSHDVRIHDNVIRGHRGPSGYALGFKESDNVDVARNAVIDNRGGLFVDGMPFTRDGFARVHDNIIAYNDVGMVMMPSTQRAELRDNTLWENIEQVAVLGGGALDKNTWQNNFWSDYAGFDASGDGVGDVPYRSERLFENLTDREPALRAFIYSPAAQAIEFAGAAMPVIRPQPKFTDPAPRMSPAPVPPSANPQTSNPAGMLVVGAALLALGLGLGWVGGAGELRTRAPRNHRP